MRLSYHAFLKNPLQGCVCVWGGGGQETPTTQPCTPREKERWLAREESARSTPQQTF